MVQPLLSRGTQPVQRLFFGLLSSHMPILVDAAELVLRLSIACKGSLLLLHLSLLTLLEHVEVVEQCLLLHTVEFLFT